MEAQTILIDSTILIDYFRKENKAKSVLFKLSKKYNLCLSIITTFEVKIGLKTERHWNDYHTVMKNIDTLQLDELCVDKAVKIFNHLKSINKLIELADLLIGATAISNSLQLATLNTKHFVNIPNLNLIPLP